MLFSSFEFIVFVPVLLFIYLFWPRPYRWVLLLAVSYYFYACWKLEYVFLLAMLTLIDYILGIQIGKTEDKKLRSRYVWLAVATNIGTLFLFKYFNFFNETARTLFRSLNIFYNIPAFKLALPVGISFYTFQSLGYIFDVYKNKRAAEKHLGIFALYVSFFPQLLSGPIERSNRMLPQFHEKPAMSWPAFKNGFALMLWGYFQKVVIADRLALYVNEVYVRPAAFKGLPLMVASLLFPFQLYADFAGYTHVAMGVALMLNYKLMDNFRRPFSARTMRDFAYRWHISLTRWIMDYVFSPLVRKVRTRWQGYAVTILVFTMVGLWHGEAWHFIIFGFLTGILIVLADVKRPFVDTMMRRIFPVDSVWFKRIFGLVQLLILFLVVTLLCIFFRANSISDIYVVLTNMFQNLRISKASLLVPNFSMYELVLAIIFIAGMFIVEAIDAKHQIILAFAEKPLLFQYCLCYLLFLVILMFGEYNLLPFIYFRF